MNFEVDKIYEDSFYINMLLGLPKILDKRKQNGVKGRHLTRYPPTLPEEITAWERKYGVSLPNEMRKFYSSTNGFLFKWIFNFGHEKLNLIGKIEINSLEKLKQIFGYETNGNPGITLNNDRYSLKLGLQSKVFELAPVEDRGKVVLVFLNARYAPSIWFMDFWKNFCYLTDDFSKYFRMMIAHLGITCWQLRFSPNGPPPWTENMFRLLAPHLLPFNQTAENLTRSVKNQYKVGHVFINKLDEGVFTGDYVPPEPVKKDTVQEIKMKPEPKKSIKEKSKRRRHSHKTPYYKRKLL